MGDRANVYCVDHNRDKGVYLYTHWQGTELPITVQKALKREQRWDDNPYLTRIIFCEMVPVKYWGEETGFGISATIGDNSHPIIVVDSENQTIGFAKEGQEHSTFVSWSFEEYIKLTEKQISEAYRGN